MGEHTKRARVLGAVNSPLAFFTLSLLLIEAMFGVLVMRADLSGTQILLALAIMSILFIGVIGVVAWLTAQRTQELLARQVDEHSKLLNTEMFVDRVTEVILDTVRKDALMGSRIEDGIGEEES